MTKELTSITSVFMNMPSFRKLLIIWMIVWLPVAGATATVMPLTGPSIKTAVATIADAAANFSADEFVMPCHAKSAGSKQPFGQSCNHCDLCHLASALAVGDMPMMPSATPSHIFTAVPLLPHPSYVPDLLSPPPRAPLA